ncbi:MAG: J domain-containing protein [Clostridiaceae bacterium]|jgi:hypothetical protein|nr:J domain-containing protein [Clostridiaceae bacterium]
MFSQILYRKNLKTLELGDNCTLAEIKEHYRHLVKLCHPDKYFSDKDLFQVAQNTLKKCNVAYEYLIQYYQMYVPPKSKQTYNDIEYETDIELEKKYKTENKDNTKYYVILNFSKQFTIVIYLYIATVIIFLFKIILIIN